MLKVRYSGKANFEKMSQSSLAFLRNVKEIGSFFFKFCCLLRISELYLALEFSRATIFSVKIGKNKVHTFWKGHKILRNLHLTFDRHYIGQKKGEDFAKFCGLLRIWTLPWKLNNIEIIRIYLQKYFNPSSVCLHFATVWQTFNIIIWS
mgnify:CR=1 FL=1